MFHRTAMARTSESLGLKTARKHDLVKGAILDYGCGRCTDVVALHDEGHDVTGYDPSLGRRPPYGCSIMPPVARGAYDLVLCTYVLNVIKDASRHNVLRDAFSYVKPGGTLLVTVRTDEKANAAELGWTRMGSGWITSAGTFQRFFKKGELRLYLLGLLGLKADVKELSKNSCVVSRKED